MQEVLFQPHRKACKVTLKRLIMYSWLYSYILIFFCLLVKIVSRCRSNSRIDRKRIYNFIILLYIQKLGVAWYIRDHGTRGSCKLLCRFRVWLSSVGKSFVSTLSYPDLRLIYIIILFCCDMHAGFHWVSSFHVSAVSQAGQTWRLRLVTSL